MTDKGSQSSLIEATRGRASFSGHGNAKGAAGVRARANNPANCEYLNAPGQSLAVSPGADGFESIEIGVAWDNVKVQQGGFFKKILNKTTHRGVDLDIGCLYELADGSRGCLQAFGKKFGDFEAPPFMRLSGDDRTGDADGYDEVIRVNGAHWQDIKRLVVYVYIYKGVPNWAVINPQIMLDVPGEQDLVVTLGSHNDTLDLCVVGGIENVRGGIKLTNYTEYFPGHEEMDRAFGFGLNWADGVKI